MMMLDHQVIWTAPAALWPEAVMQNNRAAQETAFRRPALLSFASDLFMDEFMTLLEHDPARLGELHAQPETWREPTPLPELVEVVPNFARPLNRLRLAAARKAGDLITTLPDLSAQDGATSARPLKLYQPAHQRFYLVTACLVCQIPGLPDRTLNTGKQEWASFVVRRVRRSATDLLAPRLEYALVTTPRGTRWQQVSNPNALAPDEEQLPLFAVNYTEEDQRRRWLFAGLVPVGKRETYIGAPAQAPSPEVVAMLPKDGREGLLLTQVVGPWTNLIDRARAVKKVLTPPTPPPSGDQQKQAEKNRKNVEKSAREQSQTASWYILLDFADYLAKYLPRVWAVIQGTQPESSLTADEQEVVDQLNGITIPEDLKQKLPVDSTIELVAASLTAALKDIVDSRDALESTTLSYDRAEGSPVWPSFLFPLADHASVLSPPSSGADLDKQTVDDLRAKIVQALPAQGASAPPLPLAAQPVLDAGDPGWFVIRCVFERPNCGPLTLPLLSEPTAEFQMAGFFDPDAPARPIRIALPIDTTTAGLRKFDKNTAFMVSDVLFCQMERMRGLTLGDLVLSVLPWPFHKDLPTPDAGPCTDTGAASMGMVCTLSIPIITICALLLLMIIVALLDFFFRWIPFFIACFPLPRFKAKE